MHTPETIIDPLSVLEMEPLLKAGGKFTVIRLGGGMMGADSRTLVVTKGFCESAEGPALAYSEPRKRTKRYLMQLIQKDAIILKGHLPRDSDAPITESDTSRMVLDGTGGHFYDPLGGTDRILDFLEKNLLFHTVSPTRPMDLKMADPDTSKNYADHVVSDVDFKTLFFERFGDPVNLVDGVVEEHVATHDFLGPKLKEKLRANANEEHVHPICKVFAPEGSSTWVLFGLEGDELMGVADIGMGCCEYGPVSLSELETHRGRMTNLPIEVDKHFEPKDHTLDSLTERKTLAGI